MSPSARCEWSKEFGELPLSDEGLDYWARAATDGSYPPKRIQAELLNELRARRAAEPCNDVQPALAALRESTDRLAEMHGDHIWTRTEFCDTCRIIKNGRDALAAF